MANEREHSISTHTPALHSLRYAFTKRVRRIGNLTTHTANPKRKKFISLLARARIHEKLINNVQKELIQIRMHMYTLFSPKNED